MTYRFDLTCPDCGADCTEADPADQTGPSRSAVVECGGCGERWRVTLTMRAERRLRSVG